MAFLIRSGTALYHAGIKLAAPFMPKAKRWVDGRKGLWGRLEEKASALQGCLWIHCASVGEFEQARPILESVQRERTGLPVLVTFFSPSGYEARMDFPGLTHVEYLPPDTAVNAQRLVALIRPKAAIFIKYEFWFHHLSALKKAHVPTFLVSAIFRPSQLFFRWFGGGHRALLRCYTHLFVQDDRSRKLLASIGIGQVSVSGDTRFDRVKAVVDTNSSLPIVAAFQTAASYPVLVAGSTWPADDVCIAKALRTFGRPIRTLIAPHEEDVAQRDAISKNMPAPVTLWSKVEQALAASQPPSTEPGVPPEEDLLSAMTMVMDRMGFLSRVYKYADITYVGGGFGPGIHNTLEAAAWGKPVIFGPNHQRFAEALGLIEVGAGFPVRNADEFGAVLHRLLHDQVALDAASMAAFNYVAQRTGATEKVMQGIRGSL
ncbi:MAG: hypothetical protein KBF67_07275 [Flavobacteriales bacterium]|nr:hypothetical protein [Flavobacteriales bacterium]